MTPTERKALVADMKGLGDAIAVAHSPAGQDWSGVVGLLHKSASALEALGAELAEEKAAHFRTCTTAAYEAEERDKAEAERDSLRLQVESVQRDAGRWNYVKDYIDWPESVVDEDIAALTPSGK